MRRPARLLWAILFAAGAAGCSSPPVAPGSPPGATSTPAPPASPAPTLPSATVTLPSSFNPSSLSRAPAVLLLEGTNGLVRLDPPFAETIPISLPPGAWLPQAATAAGAVLLVDGSTRRVAVATPDAGKLRIAVGPVALPAGLPGSDELFGACLSPGGRIALGAAESEGLYLLGASGRLVGRLEPGAAGSCSWLDEERLVLDRAESHRLAIWRPAVPASSTAPSPADLTDLGAAAYLPTAGGTLVGGTNVDPQTGRSRARLWRLDGQGAAPVALPAGDPGVDVGRALLSADGDWLVTAESGADAGARWLTFYALTGDTPRITGRIDLPAPLTPLALLAR